jgi:hypothetical protein
MKQAASALTLALVLVSVDARVADAMTAGERLLDAALKMKGKLHWAGAEPLNEKVKRNPKHEGYNDFTRWMRKGQEPTLSGKMNCWEVFLFAAKRGGLTDYHSLKALHERAAEAETKEGYFAVIENALNFNKAKPYEKQKLAPGDVLFTSKYGITSGGRTYIGGIQHMMIALGKTDKRGNPMVLSLARRHRFKLGRVTLGRKDSLEVTSLDKVQALPDARGTAPLFAPNPWADETFNRAVSSE